MRSLRWIGLVLLAGVVTIATPLACGGSKGNGFGDGGSGDDGGLPPPDMDGDFLDPDTGNVTQTLIVSPPNPVLQATGSPLTQQFQALEPNSQLPLSNVNWSLDNVALGSIDQNGLFTAVGNVAGVATIDATLGSAHGSTTVTVQVTLTENPGSVSAGDQAKLKAGGASDGSFRWLYPYDKTVFPRGLPAPLFQYDGATAPSAFMVHVTTKFMNYTGFFAGTNPATVQFSGATWKQLGWSAGASDPMTVEVTKIANGAVTGPKKEVWTIAQGSLRGSCYYNSYYNSGATLRLKMGQQAAQLIGGCNVCHSVSANGNVLSASYGHQYGATYDLTKNGPPTIHQTQGSTDENDYSFPGIYPDGSIFVTTYGSQIPGVWNTNPSKMIDVKTGNVINAPGLPTNSNPQMPAFSPDGKKFVFNGYASGGKTITVMDFDVKTKTFSKPLDVWTDSQWPGWPQFTPDSAKVLFHSGTGSDYATWSGNQANISSIDIATKKSVSCDALNGISNGQPYLPYGAQETNYNFEPTILPLAVGGYYWTIFTSRRYYGNTTTPQNYPSESSAQRKKLWVAAIDINPAAGKDPSHPAFYLDGQNLNEDSLRGFWALDPCKANGQTCESGDECCGGFCRQVGNTKQCVPPPMGCSNEFEKCNVAADCCDSTALCIAGHCAKPPPQ